MKTPTRSLPRRLATLASVLLLFSAVPACATPAPGDAGNTGLVTVTELEAGTPARNVSSEWATLTDKDAYGRAAIVSGKVSNVREMLFEYSYKGIDEEKYITVFDMTVDRVLGGSASRVGDVISVGVSYNSHWYDTDLPLIKDGKEFVLFVEDSSIYSNEVLRLEQYATFWVAAPHAFVVEIRDGYCFASYFFATYPSAVQGTGDILSKNPSFSGALTDIFNERHGRALGLDSSGLYVMERDAFEKSVMRKMAEFKGGNK